MCLHFSFCYGDAGNLQKEQETLWPETRRLVNPQKVYVDLSDKLYKVKSQLLEEMSMKALDLQ